MIATPLRSLVVAACCLAAAAVAAVSAAYERTPDLDLRGPGAAVELAPAPSGQ